MNGAPRPGDRREGGAVEDVMTPNVGGSDRTFRIVLGVVVVGLGIFFKSWWGALGMLPLVTGLLGWCPVYVPFHMSTSLRPATRG